jgi:hypothetical protein
MMRVPQLQAIGKVILDNASIFATVFTNPAAVPGMFYDRYLLPLESKVRSGVESLRGAALPQGFPEAQGFLAALGHLLDTFGATIGSQGWLPDIVSGFGSNISAAGQAFQVLAGKMATMVDAVQALKVDSLDPAKALTVAAAIIAQPIPAVPMPTPAAPVRAGVVVGTVVPGTVVVGPRGPAQPRPRPTDTSTDTAAAAFLAAAMGFYFGGARGAAGAALVVLAVRS